MDPRIADRADPAFVRELVMYAMVRAQQEQE